MHELTFFLFPSNIMLNVGFLITAANSTFIFMVSFKKFIIVLYFIMLFTRLLYYVTLCCHLSVLNIFSLLIFPTWSVLSRRRKSLLLLQPSSHLSSRHPSMLPSISEFVALPLPAIYRSSLSTSRGPFLPILFHLRYTSSQFSSSVSSSCRFMKCRTVADILHNH